MALTRKQYRSLELLWIGGQPVPFEFFKDILGPLDDMGLVALFEVDEGTWFGGRGKCKYYMACAETLVALLEERPTE